MNLSALIHYYIPIELVEEKEDLMFNTLLDLLAKEGLEESLKTPIVDNIFSFVIKPATVNMCIQWIETGKLTKNVGGEEKVLFELNKKHKISLVKIAYKSVDVPLQKKE